MDIHEDCNKHGPDFSDDEQSSVEALVMRKCATCRTERPEDEMLICMDSRPMHRYVCSRKCMIDFYA